MRGALNGEGAIARNLRPNAHWRSAATNSAGDASLQAEEPSHFEVFQPHATA